MPRGTCHLIAEPIDVCAAKTNLCGHSREEEVVRALLSLDTKFVRDSLKSLFVFGAGSERDRAWPKSYENSAPPGSSLKILVKENATTRAKTSPERNLTYFLETLPRDSLTIFISTSSGRGTFRNDCAEAHAEFIRDSIKCAQHTMGIVRRCFYKASIMISIEDVHGYRSNRQFIVLCCVRSPKDTMEDSNEEHI